MTEDDTIQLTIKSVPAATRDKMNRLARARGQTLGYWLTELVEKAEMDELFPPEPRASQEMPGEIRAPQSQALVPFSMSDLRSTMVTAVEMSQASGVPIPKGTVKRAFAILNKQLKHAGKLLDEALGHFPKAGQQLLLPPTRGR
jgi:hypothetical protein